MKQRSKTNILILWNEVPSIYDTWTFRVFHLLKRSHNYGYNITWISHDGIDTSEHDRKELEKYCTYVEIIDKPKHGKILLKRFFLTAINSIMSFKTLCKNKIVPTFFYSRTLQKEVDKMLSDNQYDLIYCSRAMMPYVIDVNLPKILEVEDPVLYSSYQWYLREKRPLTKLWYWLRYHHYKLFEVPHYKKFNACILVSKVHEELFKTYLPPQSYVIPYGIDLEFFKDTSIPEDTHTIIFTGSMKYSYNADAVCYFHNAIYPLIKLKMPDVKFFIVGRNPTKDVIALASDQSVTVTGFVDDVRPYFTMAALAVVPMKTDDGGFKNKILESMSMGKPVVSTSIGAKGIDVTHKVNIIIADNEQEFADSVLELLTNRSMRLELGTNARKLMVEKYSWDSNTDKLAQAFNEVAGLKSNV